MRYKLSLALALALRRSQHCCTPRSTEARGGVDSSSSSRHIPRSRTQPASRRRLARPHVHTCVRAATAATARAHTRTHQHHARAFQRQEFQRGRSRGAGALAAAATAAAVVSSLNARQYCRHRRCRHCANTQQQQHTTHSCRMHK